jgi:hypothetical protein
MVAPAREVDVTEHTPVDLRRPLLRLAMRVLAVWAALGVLLFVFGRDLMSLMLPLFAEFIEVAQGDYTATLELARDERGGSVRMLPTMIKPMALGPRYTIPSGAQLGWFSTTVAHALVPILLLLTALLAWPARHRSEWVLRAATAVPALLLVALLGAPLVLMGRVQMWLTEAAARGGASVHEPGMVSFMIFMESGGSWLIALVAALGCIFFARHIARAFGTTPIRTQPVTRAHTKSLRGAKRPDRPKASRRVR